jgi:Fe-S oxidoreductase
MGVDNAALIRLARGILTEIGFSPEGISNVSWNQWITGNQMGVSAEDYMDTLAWIQEEVGAKLGANIEIPVDKEDCDFMYVINPREVKFDPRSLINAATIFHLAGEKWTVPSYGWDQTNFGLFSGDDMLGRFMAANIYAAAQKLRAGRIVVSECGHGYRSVRWEGHNWVGSNQEIIVESVIVKILRYLDEGRIDVDQTRNTAAVTFHDSCNLARFGDLLEEPRIILEAVCSDFREMHPNRMQNFCCNGGSGLLVMPEYRSLRMEAAKIKAEQLKTTRAKIVCAMCHNCREALADIINHFHLDMEVVQIMDLVACALVLPEKKAGNEFSQKVTASEHG